MKAQYLLVTLFLCTASVASAHTHWISQGGYKSPAGVHCCNSDGANPDCKPVNTKDILTTPNGYLFKPTGETIPFHQVHASEDAHFWVCRSNFDAAPVRCFFAPPGGV